MIIPKSPTLRFTVIHFVVELILWGHLSVGGMGQLPTYILFENAAEVTRLPELVYEAKASHPSITKVLEKQHCSDSIPIAFSNFLTMELSLFPDLIHWGQ